MKKTYAAPTVTTSGNIVRETKASGTPLSSQENQFVRNQASHSVAFGL